MIIVGLDYSKNAPGITKALLDDNFNITNIQYRGFTSVLKTSKLDANLVYYHKKNSFDNDYQKAIHMRDNIIEFICSDGIPDYCAIEGYALNATGRVFDIAESTMCTKLKILELDIPLRIYTPSMIKKSAGVNGNSGKIEIGDAFVKDTSPHKPNFNHLKQYKSPSEDLVDSYYCMKLLHTELLLRYGIINQKELSLKMNEIMNQVTKSNPVNILTRDFIRR